MCALIVRYDNPPVEELSLPWEAKCFWLQRSYGTYHPRSVFVGPDKNGGPLLVCRVLHGGHLLPAKLAPRYSCAFIAWKGHEPSIHYYENLVLGSGHAEWRKASDGDVPAQAFPVGLQGDGEVTYSARATVDGILTPGRIVPSEGVARISYDGKEWTFREYEVLIIS
ncbi:uncharacterized protein [Anabrus simplex]|uniref:uncharacterized protein isoform X2 n=1 Tax=Anabrus simplex TaxID=316456 RepID=UPI0034DD0808